MQQTLNKTFVYGFIFNMSVRAIWSECVGANANVLFAIIILCFINSTLWRARTDNATSHRYTFPLPRILLRSQNHRIIIVILIIVIIGPAVEVIILLLSPPRFNAIIIAVINLILRRMYRTSSTYDTREPVAQLGFFFFQVGCPCTAVVRDLFYSTTPFVDFEKSCHPSPINVKENVYILDK